MHPTVGPRRRTRQGAEEKASGRVGGRSKHPTACGHLAGAAKPLRLRFTVLHEGKTRAVQTMPDIPQFLYLLVDQPLPIAIPTVFFAALALWSESNTAGLAAVAWNLYLIYELGMRAEQFCSGLDCMKRTPLDVVYPLLALVLLAAQVQGYVYIRDRRRAQRLA